MRGGGRGRWVGGGGGVGGLERLGLGLAVWAEEVLELEFLGSFWRDSVVALGCRIFCCLSFYGLSGEIPLML